MVYGTPPPPPPYPRTGLGEFLPPFLEPNALYETILEHTGPLGEEVNNKLDAAEKGAPSGVAPLDASSKLLETNIPTRLGDVALNTAYASPASVTAAVSAGVAPKLDAATAATTYAAKSVETSKLDVSVATATYIPKSSDAIRMTRSDIVPGADNRTAIQAIITAAAASTGIRRVILPPGEITIGAQLAIPATGHNLTIEGHGEDTVLKQITGAVNKAIIYALGTEDAKSPLTVDIPAGSTTLTIPSGVASTLTLGSRIGIECVDIVFGLGTAGQEAYASEVHKVIAVSGTTVTIAEPLEFDYTVANSAVAWKINPISGITLRNFTMTSTDAPNIKARNIMLEKVQNVLIENVNIRNSGGGIYLQDVFTATVNGSDIDGLPNDTNHLGYGLCVGGRSTNIYADNLTGRNVRHLFTTLADERVSGTTTQWGGPRHVTIYGGTGTQARTGTRYSIWDTHPYGTDIVFDACRAYGGSGGSGNGFQVRAKRVKLINPVSKYAGAQGIRIDPTTAKETEVINGEISYATTSGIGTGAGTSIRGTWIHDNTTAGVSLGDTSSRTIISNARIENNQYGIHDSSTGAHTGVVVQNNIIPKSVTQTIAILSPKSNLTYANNIVAGYGAGNDGVGGSPAGTVKKSGNITD